MKNAPLILVLVLSYLLATLISCEPKEKTNSSEWIKFNDQKTGHEVWQITSQDSMSEAFYFYAPSFTSDDKYIIFKSKRNGTMEVYRCNLTNGEINQLTDENVGSACIHPDGENMVYISDWKYYRMNVHSLKKEMVLDFTGKIPAEPQFRPSLTNDGKYTVVYTKQDDTICLYRVNLETKEILKILEQAGGSFSHQLINPVDPNLITYAPLPDTQNDMSRPMEERARAQIINVNEETNEPYLITPYGFRATHDSWSRLGNRYYFFEKSQPGWLPASIGSIDLNGKDYTKHYTNDSIKLGHGTVSQDGKWFISDGQEPHNNPLILLNLDDGKTEFLCWPNASIERSLGNVHVHPNFSTSGNYIIYTSDVAKTGTHQVYVIPIKEIKDS
ncbi:MAG: hypothetical protein HN778_07400 [Prolixibacteraceae bacterium]|jgi:Tol biopolymer transport system component|nr:hypothetical protein [Prolixibacteraceae bacterium]MBT6764949.1 hypothetical protein [Prolixibacteraceae bacterium]MBT6998081.1 hypothetical protein [Prolixibacteraceae bacterium]MBT7394643.1 hypothetical protein [Prolixibacteraceae bacterium]